MQHSEITNELVISPHYHSAVNAITQPDRMVYASRYLVRKWLPALGGDGLAILLFLRHLCFYNRRTGEKRDTVSVSIGEIAVGCAISKNTVRRQLQNNIALKVFISASEEFAVEEKRGGIIQTSHAYKILMDDPVHPSDAPRLEEELRRREAAEQAAPEDPKLRARRMAEERKRIRQVAQQSDCPTLSQIGRALPALAPSQFGRALDLVQRSPKLGGDSIDYSSLLLQTTEQQQHAGVEVETKAVVVLSAPLVSELVGRGVSRKVAMELVAQSGDADIRLQLEALQYRDAKDPAAVLVKSIRENWALPAVMFEEKKKAKLRDQDEQKAAERRAAAAAHQAEMDDLRERLQAYWDALPAAERSLIDDDVRNTLRRTNPFVAQLMERAGEGRIVQATVNAIRDEILSARLLDQQT